MEEGDVDLDPGWDREALLPPIVPPMRDRDLPERPLSGVTTGVPEFFLPGRGREAPPTPTTPSRLLWAYCALTLALRTAEGSMALLDLAVNGDWL